MNYTLITGASKGIGKALAEEFARYNCNLLLVARSADELKALAQELQKKHKVAVKYLALDLLEKGASEKLFNFCSQEAIQVFMLVNNAGMGVWNYFENTDLERQLRMMQLNQQVLVELCHRFLPMLIALPESHILNVASTAAFQPLPGFSIYAASKAFVFSFSQSLRVELKDQVNVSCLCPGPTDTSFFTSASFNHRLDKAEGLKMSVEEVARKAVDGMLAKKAVIIPGFTNKLGGLFSKLLPSSFTTTVLGRVIQYRKI